MAATVSATLLGLLQSSGQAERLGLAQDAFDAIQHQPVFQHFASVLSNDVHFVSPADEELAARHHHYEDPAVEDATLDRLIDMYLTDREAFDGDPLACELRPEIESLLKQGQLERQADEHLARSHMHVSTLQEASSVTRLQQQQAEQGLARLTRAKEHQLAQAGAANAADNASVHAVQECGHAMQDLLRQRPEEWLLLAQPLDDIVAAERLTAAEVAKAKEQQLNPAQLARRVAEQEAAQGALPDMPFGPSTTRMLAGLTTEQYVGVAEKAEACAQRGRDVRDRAERLQAELAGLTRQRLLLEQAARGELPVPHDLLGGSEAQLAAEAERLRREVAAVQESDTRHDLLDQVAAKSTAQVKKALWLVRHQQLGYMIALQKQLLEVQMSQWARVEVLQMVRSEERRSLTDLWAALQKLAQELDAAVRASAADAADAASWTQHAEHDAALASSAGATALLGSEAALCAQFAVFDAERQLLSRLATAASAAAADGGPSASASSSLDAQAGSASLSMSASGSAGAGLLGLGGGLAAAMGLGGGGLGGSGSMGLGGSISGNAFLDSVMADPSQRTVCQLAAAVEATAGLMARLQATLAGRLGDTLPRMVAAGEAGVQEARAVLACPAESASACVTTSSASALGAAAGAAWPVLRDPAFEAELAALREDLAGLTAEITRYTQRANLLAQESKAQSEQARAERGVLAGFWNAPERLTRDTQALRDRLGALLLAAGAH
ncbi:hypothetical protein CHLRE_10g460000v5 [Chlamydomonas reinhardtii]|uniref:HAUS augmin-like complex subunit 3 N-terminal domain-containing protein n=1 Tax=Chlamydomonas reinhardtii TaxID=3055 RepID=A0A2K3DBV3_CHLRE|nr:uncharacterized protein CHLRE_10g460000v5 [Chlamydomonas reinhardtii]PNW77993.1 hypothetical protein CHLRE_10g460000v5 [Chlamydomonas reinhardtii]